MKNRKPPRYTSYHVFKNRFLVKKDKRNVSVELLTSDFVYSGGIVKEAPRFPGCVNIDTEAYHRECFMKAMQNHIRNNFRYPQAGLKQKLQGRVDISFMIDKSGNMKDVKAIGPHKILEIEALRIISLLPQFIPSKENGEIVETPFSIPITFRLQ